MPFLPPPQVLCSTSHNPLPKPPIYLSRQHLLQQGLSSRLAAGVPQAVPAAQGCHRDSPVSVARALGSEALAL